jgi:dihydrolipoamide dehydrogenase
MDNNKQKFDYDLIIIGAGPGGYVAAIRAGQVGLKTLLIEKERLGGMCLNWGCIPVKALLESAKFYNNLKKTREFGITGLDNCKPLFSWPLAVERAHKVIEQLYKGIEFLLKKNSVETLKGEARIVSSNSVKVNEKTFTSENIIIATGSVPEKIDAPIPENMIIEIKSLLNYKEIPDSLCIYGEGPKALEIGQIFQMTGKQVSMIVPDAQLIPIADPVLSHFAENKLKQSGVKVFLNSEIATDSSGNLQVSNEPIPCRKVINCSKRRAVLPPMDIQLELDRGYIKVDKSLKTNIKNIYAVGDVNGLSILANVASDQGIKAVNIIKGIPDEVDLAHIPLNIYSNPEIAQVGLTEPEIKSQNIDYKITQFPLSANGKALAEGNTEGYIKLLSDKKYGEVLGVQIVSAHATDLISEASVIMSMEGTIYDLSRLLHAHPTISEIYTEVGYAAAGQPIHI